MPLLKIRAQKAGAWGNTMMEKNAMVQPNLATATQHPDILGCNAYCTDGVHCTTVLSARIDAAMVLADIAPAYCVLGWRVECVRPCEMPTAQWLRPVDAGHVAVQWVHQLNIVQPPVNIDTYTAWRVIVRALSPTTATSDEVNAR